MHYLKNINFLGLALALFLAVPQGIAASDTCCCTPPDVQSCGCSMQEATPTTDTDLTQPISKTQISFTQQTSFVSPVFTSLDKLVLESPSPTQNQSLHSPPDLRGPPSNLLI